MSIIHPDVRPTCFEIDIVEWTAGYSATCSAQRSSLYSLSALKYGQESSSWQYSGREMILLCDKPATD